MRMSIIPIANLVVAMIGASAWESDEFQNT